MDFKYKFTRVYKNVRKTWRKTGWKAGQNGLKNGGGDGGGMGGVGWERVVGGRAYTQKPIQNGIY